MTTESIAPERVDSIDAPVQVRSFCRFCQALCGIVVTVDGEQVVSVRGDDEHPTSRGYLCPKGRAMGAWHHHPRRLDDPQLGDGSRDGTFRAVPWDVALDDLGAKLDKIRAESGPNAIGLFFGTGSSFDAAGGRGAFAFFHALGSHSRYTARTIDVPCRPLVSDLIAGNPNLIPAIDVETTTMLILVGGNPVVTHGHLASLPDPVRTLRRLTGEGREVWVIDPRRTETAALATRHLSPRPGTDWALFAHVTRELLADGADHAFLADHADGLDRLTEAVAPYDSATAATITGLDPADIADFIAAIRRHRRCAVVTGTGVSMAPAANVTEWLTRIVQVVTNSYEQPGGLWFNPGVVRCMDHRSTRPSAAALAAVPGPASRPELSGRYGELPCAALADEIAAGNLRALIVVGGNLATSFPDHQRTVEALRNIDVLVVVDVIDTETTALATHVLPATGMLERADIPDYVDSYQAQLMSQYTPAVVPAGGQRKPVWWLFAQLGRRLGLEVMPPGLDPDTATDTDYLTSMTRRARLPFDELIASPTAVVVDGPQRGWVRDNVLPGGRWRVAPAELVGQLAGLAADPVDAEFPLRLIPGRQLRTLNSMLRDTSAPGGRTELAWVTVHPDDAASAEVAEGDTVDVVSSFGRCPGTLRVSEAMQPGTVHIPHGWSGTNASLLTSATEHVDPLTGMPRQTAIPVRLEPAT